MPKKKSASIVYGDETPGSDISVSIFAANRKARRQLKAQGVEHTPVVMPSLLAKKFEGVGTKYMFLGSDYCDAFTPPYECSVKNRNKYGGGAR